MAVSVGTNRGTTIAMITGQDGMQSVAVEGASAVVVTAHPHVTVFVATTDRPNGTTDAADGVVAEQRVWSNFATVPRRRPTTEELAGAVVPVADADTDSADEEVAELSEAPIVTLRQQ